MENVDLGFHKELESRKGYVLNRMVNLNSPDELRTGLSIGNPWMASRGKGLEGTPPGFFFWCGIPGSQKSFEHRRKKIGLSEDKVELVKIGKLGWDVSSQKRTVGNYLVHSPYVAHLLISISPDNFKPFQGLIGLVTSTGLRETQYSLPVQSFKDLRAGMAVISLQRLGVETLTGLGDNLKVAIYSKDNLKPDYISYREYLRQIS